jgi:hypothetical protein
MNRTPSSAAILLLVTTLACASPSDVLQRDGIQLRAEANALDITNRTSANVYFFAVGSNTATLILWAPCTRPDVCRNVESGRTLSVDYEAITGGKEPGLIVYWWHLVPAGDGTFTFDSIRAEAVTKR